MSTEFTGVRFDIQTREALNRLAAQKNTTVSEVVRQLVKNQLEVENTKESIDYIREQINEEIKYVCNPQFERLAKLVAKEAYQTVPTFYLLAYLFSEILPPTKQKDFDELKRKSKQMAIAYLKLNEKEFSEFMKSEDKALEFLDLK